MAQAESIIQNILAGIQQHAERGQAQQKIEIESKQRQAEADYQQKQIDIRHQELDESKRQFDAQHKQLAAQAAVNLLEAKQRVTENILKGIPVSGDQQAPMATSAQGGDYSPVNPNNATSIMHTIPLGEGQAPIQLSLPTPQKFAEQQAGIQRTLLAPQEEVKTREQAAQQEAEARKLVIQQEAETKRQAITTAMNNANAVQMERERQKGENYRNSVTTGTQLQIAKLPYEIFNNMPPEARTAMTQPSIDGMNNVTMSGKQVQGEFTSKGLAGAGTATISSFMGAGGVPPNEKQVDFVKQIKPVVDSLPLIQEYIQSLPKSSSGISGAVTGITHPDILNPNLESKMKEIEFNIATVAKSLGGDAGQRLQKALLKPAEGGYLPDKYKSTEYNVNNFNKLIDVVNSAVDSQLANLPQKENAKKNLGLHNVYRLNPDGSQATPLPQGGGKPIDKETAKIFYQKAGGDPAKARALATQNGWK